MTRLFDGNVLVAMTLPDHAEFNRVHRWLAAVKHESFATCAVTEGTLLRLHMQQGKDKSPAAAWSALSSIRAHPKHDFWPEGFSYAEISPTRLTGHRQVTDSWLAELARRKGGKLATLDLALAVLWPEAVFLVPV